MTDAPRTKGPGQPLGAYLLYDDDGLWLVIDVDAVTAARALNRRLGRPEHDTERYSVSGSWDATPDQIIDVLKWWPHFTNDPHRVGRPL